MKFVSNENATITIEEVSNNDSGSILENIENDLCLLWNIGGEARFMIDEEVISFDTNCILFLTEYHKLENLMFDKLRVFKFNQAFYNFDKNIFDVGERTVFFFGNYDFPKVRIIKEQKEEFELIWNQLNSEIKKEAPALKLEMLQSSITQLIILSIRLFEKQQIVYAQNNDKLNIIRDFNFLVSKHYKVHTNVSDYASLLNKSPKTLSNIFKKITDITPSGVIKNRRQIEAIRLLKYTQKSIQEISDELKFADIQTFSRFFKKQTAISPLNFRKEE